MDFKVKETEKVYHGSRIVVFRDFIEQPDGSEVSREVVVFNNAAAVVPLTQRGDVVLIKQFRYPVARSASSTALLTPAQNVERENRRTGEQPPSAAGVLVEIPAGVLDEDEEPEECARRELEEETGYTAGKLTHLGKIHTSPGVCSETIDLYLAEEIEKGDQDLEHGEVIEPVLVKFEDALEMIADGRITDAKTICGLLLARGLIERRRE
jgi:ADP-ribose pyrophosphatase